MVTFHPDFRVENNSTILFFYYVNKGGKKLFYALQIFLFASPSAVSYTHLTLPTIYSV